MVRLQFIFDLKKPIRDSVEEKNLCFFNISHEKNFQRYCSLNSSVLISKNLILLCKDLSLDQKRRAHELRSPFHLVIIGFCDSFYS